MKRPTALLLAAASALAAGALPARAQLVLKQQPATISKPVPTTPEKSNSLSPNPQVNYAVTQTLDVGGAGAWTNLTLDAAGKFLYIPRTTHTQVIDTATGKVVADIAPAHAAFDVALVPDANRGFITNTLDGTLTVFDLKTNAILGSIPIGDKPTNILYDPASKRLLVACGDNLVPLDPTLDPKSAKPETPIAFDSAVTGLVADQQGMVYASVAARNEIAVLDTRKMKIATTWPVGDWHGPGALSMDRVHGRLFVSYRANLAVMSTIDGHIMDEILLRPTQPWKFPDTVARYYDGRVFSACGDGSVTIVGQNHEGTFEVQQMMPIEANAHPIAIDPNTGKIYLPASKTQLRKTLPDSFKILVVEKK